MTSPPLRPGHSEVPVPYTRLPVSYPEDEEARHGDTSPSPLHAGDDLQPGHHSGEEGDGRMALPSPSEAVDLLVGVKCGGAEPRGFEQPCAHPGRHPGSHACLRGGMGGAPKFLLPGRGPALMLHW